MKKIISTILVAVVLVASLAGCNQGKKGEEGKTGAFDTTNTINVITREEGSGTRDAFVELTGVMVKSEDGNKTDNTTDEASTIDGTQAVMSTVASDRYSIGYISLGSFNNTVKGVKVDGVEPTPENIKSGSYKISRPFNIATKEGLSEVAQDFVDFILSTQGQKTVSDNGYVSLDEVKSYNGKVKSGKITIGGSSSVSPIMEKLKEAYVTLNPNVKIEIQTTDSTSGMTAVMDGTCDIGMASRDLKDTELTTLKATKIAIDGIVVIVNKENTTDGLSIEQIKNIYTGSVTEWDNI